MAKNRTFRPSSTSPMNKRQLPLWLLLCLCFTVADTAEAGMHWIEIPHHVDMMHMRSAAHTFELMDGSGAQTSLIQPDLNSHPLSLNTHGRVTIKPDGMEYFHVLVASIKDNHNITSAIRYFHFYGRPTGVSPSRLTAKNKTALEIVPAPLPREHWQYMAAHTARFLVRFKGQPLASQSLDMKTGNGTLLHLKTDQQGYTSVKFPDDFSHTSPGYMHNKPAEFLLRTAYFNAGDQYSTTLTADYMVNPEHWQSFTGGLGVAGSGILLGGFISWRFARKRAKNNKRKRRGVRS